MTDYISREDAINIVLSNDIDSEYPRLHISAKLIDLPTADVVEQRTGVWLGKPIAGFCTVRCSVCNEVFLENDGEWNFCPNCGARMVSE